MRVMDLGAARNNLFTRLLYGNMSRHIRRGALRARPMNRVSDHPLDQRMMINGIRFVARAEIKNPSAAAHPAISAAEDLAAFEPRNEDLLIGRRDTEWFAVTFGVFQFDEPVDPASNP